MDEMYGRRIITREMIEKRRIEDENLVEEYTKANKKASLIAASVVAPIGFPMLGIMKLIAKHKQRKEPVIENYSWDKGDGTPFIVRDIIAEKGKYTEYDDSGPNTVYNAYEGYRLWPVIFSSVNMADPSITYESLQLGDTFYIINGVIYPEKMYTLSEELEQYLIPCDMDDIRRQLHEKREARRHNIVNYWRADKENKKKCAYCEKRMNYVKTGGICPKCKRDMNADSPDESWVEDRLKITYQTYIKSTWPESPGMWYRFISSPLRN